MSSVRKVNSSPLADPATVNSEEEFHALSQQKTRKTDPAMLALLAEVETGRAATTPQARSTGPSTSRIISSDKVPRRRTYRGSRR
jgi:hypothetical protein